MGHNKKKLLCVGIVMIAIIVVFFCVKNAITKTDDTENVSAEKSMDVLTEEKNRTDSNHYRYFRKGNI